MYNQGFGNINPRPSNLGNQPQLDYNLSDNWGNNTNQNNYNNYGNYGQQNNFQNPGMGYNNYNSMGGFNQNPKMGATAGGYSNPFAQNLQNPYPNQNFQNPMGNNFDPYAQQNPYIQAIMEIADFIRFKNVNTLNQFFNSFDCYRGRNIERWELSIMFPRLQQAQEEAIIQRLGDKFKDGKIDMIALVKEIEANLRGIVFQDNRDYSIYKDKIRNIQAPMTRLDQIAKQVLNLDRQGTYASAYDREIFRKPSINIEDLFNILSKTTARVDRNEVNQIFTYLAIDDFNSISKIQFVQGFRNIFSDTEGFNANAFDQNQLSPQCVNFLREIQEFLISQGIRLQQILQDIGVPSNANHIRRNDLEALGRQARVSTNLNLQQLNEIIAKYEDRTMPNCVMISNLEEKLNSFGIVSNKRVESTIQKEAKLAIIKDYMGKNNINSIEQLFTNVQSQDSYRVATKEEFIVLLTSPKFGISQPDSEQLSLIYEQPQGSGKINLTRLNADIDLLASSSMSMEKANTLMLQLFDQIKRQIARKEMNLVDIFVDCDEDDGYLNKKEIKDCFQRIGIITSDEDITAIFLIFDPRNTDKCDHMQILEKFYEYANKNIVKPDDKKLYPIYEKIRNYLRQKKFLSISSFLLEDRAHRGNDIKLGIYELLQKLTRQVMISELSNKLTEQTFCLSVSDASGQNLDYDKFADFVGYEFPKREAEQFGQSQTVKIGKRFETRRFFYRTLIRSLASKQPGQEIEFNQLENFKMQLRMGDINLQGLIDFNHFGNTILRICNKLADKYDVIKQVSIDYSIDQNYIDYERFIERVQFEYQKLAFLDTVYKNFYETLEFKQINDLYRLFLPFDTRKDKKFDKDQVFQIFSKVGVTVRKDVKEGDLKYVFDEYDTEKSGFIKYEEFERDFKELTEDLKYRLDRQEANLPKILQTIKSYLDNNGLTLRQYFNKTKVGDPDQINQNIFGEKISFISQKTGQLIKENSIHRFKLELTTGDTKSVSFTELLKMFNQYFNIRDDDEELFKPFYIDKLQWHIVKVTIDKKPLGFKLEDHFMYPTSTQSQFLVDLKKDPLFSNKEATFQIMDEMAKRYSQGSYVNTQNFIVDINEKIFKMEQKNQIIFELRKQVQLKNLKIEDVFNKAMPEIQKFQLTHLSPEEFQSVFLFVEYKITIDRVRKMLQDFFTANEKGKYSYLDFIKEFEATEKGNNQYKGRRFFQTLDEILRRVATCIDQRGLKNFGTLLADQDLKNNNTIQKDSFYRTLDSLQIGLGEGDIQEIMRTYQKDADFVDLIKFRDDLNSHIMNPQFKIQLKSVLNQVVKERVVDNIELSPRSMNNQKELQEILKHMPLIKDIMCGLFVKTQDVTQWFSKYSSFVKGSLTAKEFISAVEMLDVQVNDQNMKQTYYDLVLNRQENILGYKSQVLLIEQLQFFMNKDCPLSRDQMVEEIIYDIARYLSDKMIPVKPAFESFDKGDGYIFRQDFITSILDNYLKLQTIMTINKKVLLTQKYAPHDSMVRMTYDAFIEDLKRQQMQHPKNIRIYMTQLEIDEEEALRTNQTEAKSNWDNNEISQQRQFNLPDPLAQSKKNTVCTEITVTKQMKVDIPSFQFEDIMLETYRRGVAVEVYFKKFSKFEKGAHILSKDEFTEAISNIGVKWKDHLKIGEMFDALDIKANSFYLRTLRIEDIGEAVLQNALYTVEDFQAKTIEALYTGLKQKQMLAKLRDLFNFFNTRRDNTCQALEFKKIFLEKMDFSKLVTDAQLDLLIFRYKSMQDASRVEFTQFIRDMEYCDLGIKPSLIWAISLAEDIIKSLNLNNFSSPEQFFQRFIKMQGLITFEEFKRAMDDLQLSIYHDDEEQRNFFNHIEMQENQQIKVGNVNNYSKVGLNQMCATIKKLCQKNMSQLYSEILEKIYADSKRMNFAITVYTIFTDFDLQKSGHVHFTDFKYALEEKLHCKSLKPLDLQFLAKRYRSNQRGVPEEMVQYEKFFQDYEKMEKFGLRAGFDPLKTKSNAEAIQNQEVPPEVKKIYQNITDYCNRLMIADRLCDELASKDARKIGMLPDTVIHDVFKSVKMAINKKQLNYVIYPLNQDRDGNFNYLLMIEKLFGKQKAQEIKQRHRLQGTIGLPSAPVQSTTQQRTPLNPRFKDQIELNYQTLFTLSHQMSRGSFLLREQEYQQVFKRSGLVILNQDLDWLTQTFHQMKNPHTQAIDFRQLVRQFEIRENSSLIVKEIQKELALKNLKIEEMMTGLGSTITFEEFMNVLDIHKIDVKSFTEEEIKELFAQVSQRKEHGEKANFIRLFRNEQQNDQKSDYLPYIVNELVYFICNNNIDLFKIVSPQAKKLTLAQFQQTLQAMKYIPSNPKELQVLYSFFQMDGAPDFISIEKLLIQIRKINPNYALSSKSVPGKQVVINDPKLPQPSKQLSIFTTKIKTILSKINDQCKRNGISPQILYQQIDLNKNGILEKQEFIAFFLNEMVIQGLKMADLDLLFDALDMNKDGHLSINEFCLCIEGIQLNKEQRMKAFDLDLEKDMIKQINELFDFFDKNSDNQITTDELQSALRSLNQNIGLAQIQEIMKQVDKNNSGSIDRQEFINLMLPKFKEEILLFDQNLEDLRRIFKESDLDHSNYLSKSELQAALRKVGVELTEVQVEELMKELDLDQNQSVDIDEFIAFLSIADQLKFRNPANKTTLIRIRHARKLHAIDFYNCFKNLPSFFLPSFTQDPMEKKGQNTPSWGIYPEFESRTMVYKDLQKLEDISNGTAVKKFIDLYAPHIGCEIQLEECTGVPLPKKEDFDWAKISHREIRAALFDFKTHEFLSNTFILGAAWKPEYEGKWLFNTSESLTSAKNFMVRTDLLKNGERDIHLLFELVLYTNAQDVVQQVACAWGSIPAVQLDKAAKQRVTLKGGSPLLEMKIDQADIHQEKKGFNFLKKIAAQTDESQLILNVKPFAKFQEQTQYHISMLPSTCLVSKRLLSFVASFRLYCYRKLIKYQQLMIAPAGNFVIAQFRKIYDNPDVNFILGDCWETEIKKLNNQINLDVTVKKMEEFMTKLYSIVYSQEFGMDHIFPTRSSAFESEIFTQREILIKQALLPASKFIPAFAKPKKKEEKVLQSITNIDDYKPFNIAEMEIQISGMDSYEGKQDELIKMYQQMGLIQ